MARDDTFKKYQEAGADFLEQARARAEEFLRELARASGTTQKQAQDTFEEVFEGSRRGTEQMISSIRQEITAQLGQLGLATKADLEALERRLTATPAATPTAPAATPTTPVPAPPTTAAPRPVKRAASKVTAPNTGAPKTATQKTATTKSAAAKKATGGAATPASGPTTTGPGQA